LIKVAGAEFSMRMLQRDPPKTDETGILGAEKKKVMPLGCSGEGGNADIGGTGRQKFR